MNFKKRINFIIFFLLISGIIFSIPGYHNISLFSSFVRADDKINEIPEISGIKMEIPSVIQAGTYLHILDTIRNKGSTSTGPFSLQYYLEKESDPDSDTYISTQIVDNLVPGGQKTLNFSSPVPADMAPGTYHVIRIIQVNDIVLSSGSEMEVSGLLSDITIMGLEEGSLSGFFESFDSSLPLGEEYSIKSWIRNTNETYPVISKLSYYLSATGLIDENLIFLGESPEITIANMGESYEDSRIIVHEQIPEGDYYLIASFLPIGVSEGHSELYWVSENPVFVENAKPLVTPVVTINQVQTTSEPDLTTVKTEYPDIMNIGESFQISDSVQNIGGTVAGIVRVEYLLSSYDDGSKGTHLAWWTMHNVKPGEIRSSEETLGIPSNIRPGIYYFSKKISVTSNPPEVNTDNNYWTGNRPVRVEYSPTAKIPDLTHINTKFPRGIPGDTVEIIDTITNIGNACANNVAVAYYLSPYSDFDPSTATYLGVWNVDRICVGEQLVKTTPVTILSELKNGVYYWYSVIDPCSFMSYCGDEMPELDKSNNINVGRFVIGPCVFGYC